MSGKEDCRGCMGFGDAHTCEDWAKFQIMKAHKDKCFQCEAKDQRIAELSALLRESLQWITADYSDERTAFYDKVSEYLDTAADSQRVMCSACIPLPDGRVKKCDDCLNADKASEDTRKDDGEAYDWDATPGRGA